MSGIDSDKASSTTQLMSDANKRHHCTCLHQKKIFSAFNEISECLRSYHSRFIVNFVNTETGLCYMLKKFAEFNLLYLTRQDSDMLRRGGKTVKG